MPKDKEMHMTSIKLDSAESLHAAVLYIIQCYNKFNKDCMAMEDIDVDVCQVLSSLLSQFIMSNVVAEDKLTEYAQRLGEDIALTCKRHITEALSERSDT